MRTSTKLLLALAGFYCVLVAILWRIEVVQAEGQYYHAVMAEEAAIEAESAWGLMEVRVDALNLPDSAYNYARDQRIAVELMRQEIHREVVALETRLARLTFDRWRPEDR